MREDFSPYPGMILHDRYLLDELLGEGGSGSVWAARARGGGSVALKFLHQQSALHEAPRLQREASALSWLSHPNIVRTFELLLDPAGRPVLVMELLRGRPLSAELLRGPLGTRQLCGLAAPVADALLQAHAHGVVHRDLKPSNLFLSDDGRLIILDFGHAKLTSALGDITLTASGDILGTPSYMAPEQLEGARSIDGRADVWALGAVLYECLTGRRFIPHRTLGQVMRSILMSDFVLLGELDLPLPPRLVGLVDRMLEVDSGRRLGDLALIRDTLLHEAGA
jgi:serine/threonine-protein kinase